MTMKKGHLIYCLFGQVIKLRSKIKIKDNVRTRGCKFRYKTEQCVIYFVAKVVVYLNIVEKSGFILQVNSN